MFTLAIAMMSRDNTYKAFYARREAYSVISCILYTTSFGEIKMFNS